jgi:hypothetical protein
VTNKLNTKPVKIPRLVYQPVEEIDEEKINDVFNYLFEKLLNIDYYIDDDL